MKRVRFLCLYFFTLNILLKSEHISAVIILTHFGVAFSYLTLQFPGSSLLFCGIVLQLFSLFSVTLII